VPRDTFQEWEGRSRPPNSPKPQKAPNPGRVCEGIDRRPFLLTQRETSRKYSPPSRKKTKKKPLLRSDHRKKDLLLGGSTRPVWKKNRAGGGQVICLNNVWRLGGEKSEPKQKRWLISSIIGLVLTFPNFKTKRRGIVVRGACRFRPPTGRGG